MNNEKKNNKGFSLVELIVVVLIMAIIAVSLAPQVMKWVDRSRAANDAANYDALVAAAQLSMLASKTAESGSISMGTDETEITASAEFIAAMNVNLPDWDDIKITATTHTGPYTITLTGSEVKRNNAPGEIPAS